LQAFSVLFASSFAITRHAIVGMGSHAGFHDGPASVVGHVQEAYLACNGELLRPLGSGHGHGRTRQHRHRFDLTDEERWRKREAN